MDRLTAMQVFSEVAQRGSFTAAADQLGMTRVMVTRYVTQLEKWLGGRLLQRSYACDEDGRTIKVVMKLRIVAERAGIGTGRLRRVLAGTEYIEGWFDNAGLALKEGTRVDFAYSIGVRGDVGRDAIPRSSSDWGLRWPVTSDGLGPARWQRLEVLGEHVPPGRGACWLGAVPLHRRRVGGRLRT